MKVETNLICIVLKLTGEESFEAKMSSMIKTQKAVKSTKTEMTADEKKRKEAILAQYSQVCDGEYPFNNNRTLQLKTGTCSAQS